MSGSLIAKKIYVASSWRNPIQPEIVQLLRSHGHDVYDFRKPAPGNHGFAWRDVDPDWQSWTPWQYLRRITRNPLAADGFALDKAALDWCDTCVLVLPCGRSGHLEAGYAAGQGKRVIALLSADGFEPELMYLLCAGLVLTADDLVEAVEARAWRFDSRVHP